MFLTRSSCEFAIFVKKVEQKEDLQEKYKKWRIFIFTHSKIFCSLHYRWVANLTKLASFTRVAMTYNSFILLLKIITQNNDKNIWKENLKITFFHDNVFKKSDTGFVVASNILYSVRAKHQRLEKNTDYKTCFL